MYFRSRKNRIKKIFFWVFILFFFLINFSPLFLLKSVSFQKIHDPYIEENIELYLNRNFFHSFYKKNIPFIFFFLRKDIEKKFPQIIVKKILFNFKGGKLIFFLQKRDKRFIVCDKRERDEKCFFVDENGFVFSEAPFFSEGLVKKIFLNKRIVLGDVIFPKKIGDLISSLIDKLENSCCIVTSVFLNEKGRVTIFVSNLFSVQTKSVKIILPEIHEERDIENIFSLLFILKSVKIFQKEFFKERKNLYSIDLSFPKQIRYKIEEDDKYEKKNKK